MKRKFYLIILPLLLCFCNKVPFRHVTMTGQVVNYFTKSPLSVYIEFGAITGHGGQGSDYLGKINTDENGNFKLKCSAEKSEKYWMSIATTASRYYSLFSLNPGGTQNFGQIETGEQTFLCKVTIVPVSTSAIEFPGRGPNNTPLHFNAGTSTSFVTSWSNVDKDHFNQTGKKFLLWSSTFPGGIQVDTLRKLPIPSLDTLRVTINY